MDPGWAIGDTGHFHLPACQLRPDCRWWKQEGKAACMRCPLVMTDCYTPPNQVQSVVANPHTPVAARV